MKCKNLKLFYYYAFVSCFISRLFVYLRMRMSTPKQHSCVRGPLQECRSIRSGASGLPYYCAPLVCVSDVMKLLTAWRHNKPKTKNQLGKELKRIPHKYGHICVGFFLSPSPTSFPTSFFSFFPILVVRKMCATLWDLLGWTC